MSLRASVLAAAAILGASACEPEGAPPVAAYTIRQPGNEPVVVRAPQGSSLSIWTGNPCSSIYDTQSGVELARACGSFIVSAEAQ